jgi:Ca2+-binding RTX toxin-like protein
MLEIVESNDGPTAPKEVYRTIDAGQDVFAQLTGLQRRALSGGEGGPTVGFVTNIDRIRAGHDVNLVLGHGVDQTAPGSLNYIIEVDQAAVVIVPTPSAVVDVTTHFRPATAGTHPTVFPLGVFGTGSGAINATYRVGLLADSDKRLQAGNDIDVTGPSVAPFVNFDAITNILGAGEIDVFTSGDIFIEESDGDLRVGRITSTLEDVWLKSPGDIVDAFEGAADDVVADVTGRDITLLAINGAIGDECIEIPVFVPPSFLEIDSSFSGSGKLYADALNEIYIDEVSGNLRIDFVNSRQDDVDLHTRAGGMLDAGAGLNNIEARSIDLIAVGGGIGEFENDLDIDTDNTLGGGTVGRLYTRATGSIYITENDEELDVLLAHSLTGDVRLTIPDEASTGEDLNLSPNGGTLECVTITEGRIDAAGSVTLNVGDNVTTTATSTIIAGTTINVVGDRNGISDGNQADTGVGTIMTLRGKIETRGSESTDRANFYGNVDGDSFTLNDLQLNTQTNIFGSNTTVAPAAGGNEITDVDGRDNFTVNQLRTMTTHRNGAVSGIDRRDTLNLDGQGDTDTYFINTGGSLGQNTGGELRDYIISVLDTGVKGDGEDTLEINGSNDPDIFLLRQLSELKAGQDAAIRATEYDRVHGTTTSGAQSIGYVALLHGADGTGPGKIRQTDPVTGYVTNGASDAVERVNYTENINARLIVRGFGGNDVFAVDDNAAITTLDGGLGNDAFQIGQMYGAPRVAPAIDPAGTANPPNLAPEDSFSTIRVTRGDLSRGASFSLVAMGDKGDDIFTVYSNKAELRLEGNDDNDTFIVRAFVLADQNYQALTFGGVSTENTTLIQPGDGDDLVQYNINAPVDVDGGRGFDKLVVLGTEFADNFVITDEAIWGAGLKVSYKNVEAVEVDGLEGNDQFFVQSTAPRVITSIIGGLGSDTIDVASDVTGPIQARELEGRGSMINHTVTSQYDDGYDGLNAAGLRLNIATPENGGVIINESNDSTVVTEASGADNTDSYTVKLAAAPVGIVYVTVSASRTTSREEVLGGDSMTVSTAAGPFDKYVVLAFNSSNWNMEQTVTVKGVNDTLAEGERVYAISHTVQAADPADAAFNHLAVKNVKVTVLDNDKPDIIVRPSGFESLVLEGPAPEGITDIYDISLAANPFGDVWVKLDVVLSQISLSTGLPAGRFVISGGDAYMKFDGTNWNTPVTVTMTAVNDAVAENRGWSTITHTVFDDNAAFNTTSASYLSTDPELKPVAQYLDVEVVDNDTPGVLVTESNGRTLVVQDTNDLNNATQDDTYTIRLTKQPTEKPNDPLNDLDVRVTVWLNDDGQTVLTPQGIDPSRIVTNPITGKTGVMFNETNWFTPVTINVHAKNDFVPTTLQEVLIPFPRGEHLLNDLRGPLFIEGGVVEADRSIVKPVMLPDEISPPPKEIGPQPPEYTRIDVIRVYNDASVSNDVGFLGDGTGSLPFVPKEKDGGLPRTTRLSGLSLSGDWTVDGGSADGAITGNTTFKGGITYHGMERFELLLGEGDDNLTITNTLYVSGTDGHAALYGGLSVIHGGGGNDTVTVTGEAGGADSPLVVYGDTSADGYRYSWSGADGTTISENATGFDNPGNDLLDAAGALGTVTLYGGRGNDRLIGGSAGDILAGGSGGDVIVGNSGNDHIYGDSGINVDIVSRRFGSDMSGLPNWFVKDGSKFLFDETVTFDFDGAGPKPPVANGLALLDPGKADDLTAWLVDTTRETWQDSLDSGNDLITGDSGNDIIFGDHGIIKQTDFGALKNLTPSLNRKVLGTGTGLANTTNTITLVQSKSNQNGGVDTVFGGTGEDVLIGGANGDNIDGQADKDLIFGDNVTLDRSATKGDLTNPRFRVLTGTQIYSKAPGITSGQSQVTGAWQVDPNGSAVWTDYRVELDNHDDAAGTPALLSSGNDYIAGGGQNDQIFGEMGNDTVQGDGSIGTFNGSYADRYATAGATLTTFGAFRTSGGITDPVGPLTVNGSFETAATDGDDYIEGNGGNDVIFGNLGQDDIIGGSSNLFSLTTPGLRPDGLDLIFGGAGTDISHNNLGDASLNQAGDTIVTQATGHSRDADMILGDNGNMFRLVGVNGANSGNYLTFNYDNYNGLKIIPRVAELLDYTPGGIDYSAAAAGDIGAADEIHGESGDDFIYGMKGNDVLFGEGQDDDLIGGYGNDWISGGTGDDGVIGDDGRISTSRNGTADPLGGVAATTQGFVKTGGSVQQADTNVTGQLKKTVNITPFSQDPTWNPATNEFSGTTRGHSDDIIFGGWGNDFLHGGSGDDAISGAEALTESYAPTFSAVGVPNGRVRIDYDHPVNPGNVLAYNPVDANGKSSNRTRAGEFYLYDEYDPLRKILLNPDGSASKWTTTTPSGFEYFLNFSATEGPAATQDPTNKKSDGDDKIFGDLGNDWIVGGSGRDDMYGGFGNDLLNADDDLLGSTGSALNNTPDTSASYEDRAFGGAGRDVLIANTGGDRLIDWSGEFNSYLVPFSPFGVATVSRMMQPALPEFLYALSASDGADPTRASDIAGADPARNGEPWGELGLVLQKDAAWKDQHGGPADPQPGNIGGTQRDVLRSATFTAGGAAQGFNAQVGTGVVVGNYYQSTPAASGGDAISLFNTADTVIPVYFEMQASINAVKATGGNKANAFLIFDWQSNTDFKFAGIDISTNKLEVGHRTASGWVVDNWTNVQVKADTDYVIMLKANGSTATAIIGTSSVSFTFAPRVVTGEAGIKHLLNEGIVGIGGMAASARITNVIVQKAPEPITVDITADFSSTSPASNLFKNTTAPTGTWVSGSDNRFAGTTTDANAAAINLASVGAKPITAGSLLNITTTVKTSGMGGIVFDYQGPNYYKYVVLSADTNQIIVGHRTGNSWITDATYAFNVSSSTDYKLGVSLRGGLVNVSINGAVLLSKIYSETVTVGGYGLISRKGVSSGLSSFDIVQIKSDEGAYAPATPLLQAAAADPATFRGGDTPSAVDLAALLAEAKARWAASGLDAASMAKLDSVTVQLADLPGAALGEEVSGTVFVDLDAAGRGWFIDATPQDNAEFHFVRSLGEWIADAHSPAFGRMDLLTTVMHELGHALGFGHESGLTVMQDSLETGIRRLVGENSFHVEGGVVAAAARNPLLNGQGAASRTPQAIARPAQVVAAHADFSRIRELVGTDSLIDWTDNVPGNGHTVDPSLTPKDKLSWVRRFLSDLGTHTGESHADHELEVTLPGKRT